MDSHVREREGLFPSRREALHLGMSALVAGMPAIDLTEAVAHYATDARLKTLGDQFERHYAEWLPLRRACGPVNDRMRELALNLDGPFTLEAYKRICRESGWDDLSDRIDPVTDALAEVVDAIFATPAEGLAGLRVKLQALAWHCLRPGINASADEHERSSGVVAHRALLADVDRMMGAGCSERTSQYRE